MAIKQSLDACLKQASVLEREAKNLDMSAKSQTRLSSLLATLNNSLAEIERIIRSETPEASEETLMKLRLWEKPDLC